MKAPGDRLHRVLGRWLDDSTMREVVEPTLADVQHELRQPGAQRWFIRWRGYVGLACALLLRGAESGAAVRTAVAVVVIGVGGGVLYRTARLAVHDPRVFQSALLFPMAVAALVLRFTGGAKNYRRILAGLFSVGALMWMVGGGFARTLDGAPWSSRVAMTVVNLAIVGGLSVVGAAAVWTPLSRPPSTIRRVVLGLLFSAAVTTSVYDVSMWISGAAERAWLITLPFYVAVFAVPLALTSLPVLFIAARWIPTQAGRVAIGVLTSPLPMLAVLWLDTGGAKAVIQCLHDAPMQSAFMTLPFTVGNAFLVRSLPSRRFTHPAR